METDHVTARHKIVKADKPDAETGRFSGGQVGVGNHYVQVVRGKQADDMPADL
ncbi:hypothetical protein D3C73_1353490 [compost metagenome]